MADLEKIKNIKIQNLESKDVIIPNDKKWSEKLKYFKQNKNEYNINITDFPDHVTHKFQKEQECSFNPITQKYTDKNQEKSIKLFDKTTKIDNISKGYDHELNLESTYNIINLQNKLKSLNYSEDKYKKKRKIILIQIEIFIKDIILYQIILSKYNITSPLNLEKTCLVQRYQ